MCTRPKLAIGYDFSFVRETLEAPDFKVSGLKCQSGYAFSSPPQAFPCSEREGGEYIVSGCSPVQCPATSYGSFVSGGNNSGCNCKPGFVGNVIPKTSSPFYQDLCRDVDECIGIDCGGASKCINGQNQYKCECADGWMFTGINQTCREIDDCKEILEDRYNITCGITRGIRSLAHVSPWNKTDFKCKNKIFNYECICSGAWENGQDSQNPRLCSGTLHLCMLTFCV